MKAEQTIFPRFNTAVIFSTTSFTYHGHPDPLKCPEDRSRKSLAYYYFSTGRTKGETLENQHSTLFKERKGENFNNQNSLKNIIKNIVPPILTKIAKKILQR